MGDLGFTRSEDERLWAALAHATILLGVILGYLGGLGLIAGPAAAFVIYLVKKDESRWVGRQAIQALVYQGVLAVIGIILFIITMAVGVATLGAGLLCIGPLLLILSLAFLAYGLYGAYQCYQGKNFKYYYLGDFIGGL